MKKVIFTLCLVISVCCVSYADWIQSSGPYGGTMTSIERQGNTLYVGTTRGFYVSYDAGASWINRRINSTEQLQASATLLYSSATELFVARNDGVYRTTDDGLTWTKLSGGLPFSTYYSMIKLSNGSYLLGATSDVYSSTDGITWTAMGLTGASNYTSLAESNGALFAVAHSNSVFRSLDQGLTWEVANTGLQSWSGPVRPTGIVALNNVLYVSTNNNTIYRSTNGATSWSSYASIPGIAQSLQAVNNELYVLANPNGLYRNNPAVNSAFTQSNSFSAISSQVITDYVIWDTEVFCVSNGFGVWKATLGQSATLVERNNQLAAGVDVEGMTSANGVLFAATERLGVYKSLDEGLTWQACNQGLGSLNLTDIFAVGNDLYALTVSAGVYKSSDLGATWTLFNTGLTNIYVLAFAKVGSDFYVGGSSGRVYKSTGGTSPWQLVNTGLPADQITRLVYNGNTLFACTNTSSRVHRFDQGSNTWSPSNNGLPSGATVKEIIADGTKLYASMGFSTTAVFQSLDNGNTWTAAAGGLPASTVISAFTVLSPGTILALTGNELYKTTDGGNCWKASDPIAGYKVSDSRFVYHFNGRIFAGPRENGIWYRSISETPVSSLPVAPVITGPASVCNPAGKYLQYSVPYNSSYSYNWTLPVGSTLTSSNLTSHSIEINMGNSSGTISVSQIYNGCASALATKSITVGVNTTPVISGSNIVCAGATGNVYTVQNAVAGSTYTWSSSSNVTFTSESPTSIAVTLSSGTGWINVYETSNSCNSNADWKYITLSSPAQGPLTYTQPCEGGTTTIALSGASTSSTFNWTATGAALVSSNAAGQYLYLTLSQGAADVTVQETTSAGCAGPLISTRVQTIPKPQTSAIAGPSEACATTTLATYSVEYHAGSYYHWQVPLPATIISGAGTNSIQVDWTGAPASTSLAVHEEKGACVSDQQVKLISLVDNTPINAASIQGPAAVCLNQEANYSVAGKLGSTFTWTVPSGASILSGQGTPNLSLSTQQASGIISVVETDVCNNTGPANTLALVVQGYVLPSQQITCASNIFCQTIQAATPISGGVIGLDFALRYDAALLTPTGRVTLGPVATSYAAYAVNTTTPGIIYVTLYLNQAPANVFISGTGDVACVEFSRTAAFTPTMTTQITADPVIESTLNTTNEICAPAAASIELFMLVKGKLTYRNTSRAIQPSATTAVQVMDANCTSVAAPALALSSTGTFEVASSGALNLRVERDIVGDASVDPLNCSNVMLAINATDRNRAADISTNRIANPTIYELISADVNLDGKVTAGDVTLISARSVNMYNCEFPQANYAWNGSAYVPASNYQKSKDWIFVPTALLNDPAYTAGMSKNRVPQFPACTMMQPLSPCNTSAVPAIEGILLGDVNGNWAGGTSYANIRATAPALIINLQAAMAIGNDQYMVPVSCQHLDEFSALDFELDFNGSKLSIVNVSAANASTDFGYLWNNMNNEKLFVTCFSQSPQANTSALLYVTVHAPDGLSAADMEGATAYINDEAAPVSYGSLVTGNQQAAGSLLVDAYPNPFSDQFSVALYSATASEFNVTVSDLRGTEVYRKTCTGNQTIDLGNGLPSGVYLLKVTTESETKVVKMVKQ